MTDLDHLAEGLRKAARNRQRPELLISWIAEHLSEVHGWRCPPGTRMHKYLHNRVTRAHLEWVKAARSELTFEARPIPDAMFLPALYEQDAEAAPHHELYGGSPQVPFSFDARRFVPEHGGERV